MHVGPSMRCPAGHTLAHKQIYRRDRSVIYAAEASACGACALKPSCTTARRRLVTRHGDEAVLQGCTSTPRSKSCGYAAVRWSVPSPSSRIDTWGGASCFEAWTVPDAKWRNGNGLQSEAAHGPAGTRNADCATEDHLRKRLQKEAPLRALHGRSSTEF